MSVREVRDGGSEHYLEWIRLNLLHVAKSRFRQ